MINTGGVGSNTGGAATTNTGGADSNTGGPGSNTEGVAGSSSGFTPPGLGRERSVSPLLAVSEGEREAGGREAWSQYMKTRLALDAYLERGTAAGGKARGVERK